MKMKRIMLMAVMMIAAVSVWGSVAPRAGKKSRTSKGEGEIVLATYNLRLPHKDDDKKGNGWDRRLPELAKVIKK